MTNIKNTNDIESLMSSLKKEDARNLRISRNIQWLYFIMIPIYAGIYIINPDGELSILQRLSGACFVLAFTIFGLSFRNAYKIYRSIDYSKSTIELMKEVVRRYKFWNPKLLWLLFGIFIVDIGVILNFYQRDGQILGISKPWFIQVFFFTLVIIGILVRRNVWKTRQKPLKDLAQNIINEIES